MKPLGNATSEISLRLFLSHSGFCSRRNATELILNGKVKVNGQVVREPSLIVHPQTDRVAIDHAKVLEKSLEYVLLNKPKDYVTSTSRQFGEKLVIDILPKEFKHLRPVGRLDKDTEGLLLLTNDGDLAYRLTHPKFNIDKRYVVTVIGKLKPADQKRLEEGIVLEGEKTSKAKITDVKVAENKTDFVIAIHEGKKRQIRRMLAEVGHRVVYLKRIMQGPLVLGNLKLGAWRRLSVEEIETLRKEIS